jgi:hypothetical protein
MGIYTFPFVFFSTWLYIFFASDTLGFKFYERFELIPKFCKVEFVCFNGEPNWMGELFLYAPFPIILWLLISIYAYFDFLRKNY